MKALASNFACVLHLPNTIFFPTCWGRSPTPNALYNLILGPCLISTCLKPDLPLHCACITDRAVNGLVGGKMRFVFHGLNFVIADVGIMQIVTAWRFSTPPGAGGPSSQARGMAVGTVGVSLRRRASVRLLCLLSALGAAVQSLAQEWEWKFCSVRVIAREPEDFLSYTFKTNKLPSLNKDHLEDSVLKLIKRF